MGARFPDFIIAGAPRSGTTSLARYLGEHPAVYMAPQKEVRFFDQNYARGVEWYKQQFAAAPDDVLCGEASPRYMSNPTALDRLKQHLPGAILLMSLREPAQRSWSGYLTLRERNLEARSFEEVISDEIDIIESEGRPTRDTVLVGASLYATHLGRILELFDRSQVKVSVFERMVDRPEAIYSRLCRELGIDDSFRPTNLGQQINPYVEFRSLKIRTASKKTRARPVRRLLSRVNTRTKALPPQMPDDTRDRLAEFFAPYNAELEDLLDISLPEWS